MDKMGFSGCCMLIAAIAPAYAQSMSPDDPAARIAPTPQVPGVSKTAPSPAADPAPAISGSGQDPVVGAPTPTVASIKLIERKYLFGNLVREPDEFTLVNDRSRVSFHKPMYLLPVTYSNRYSSDKSEFVFDISMKLQMFGTDLFFAYTQRSFWQLYNASDSRPFRETDYNPELFYRWKPRFGFCLYCGVDVGLEHESNGRDVPDSRSWNRAYLAVYHEWERTLLYLKTWYRIPEKDKKAPDDPEGDDNPDIHRYYGYGELRLQQELFADKHLAALMVRGNPSTGKAAIELNYSVPFGEYLYWNVYLFNGYGDSLIDYNRNVTRVGVGLMLAR